MKSRIVWVLFSSVLLLSPSHSSGIVFFGTFWTAPKQLNISSCTAQGEYMPCTNAYDGVDSVGWNAGWNGSAWIKFDLGASKFVSYFSTFAYMDPSWTNTATETYEVSTDDVTYTTVGSTVFPSSSVTADNTWRDSVPVNRPVRYIRVTSAHSFHWVHVNEFKVYGRSN